MTDKEFAAALALELDAEFTSTHKCLERIPVVELFNYKPHEKSMEMGYLAILVADIPHWISLAINDSEIDFATYEHFQPKSTEDLVARFEKNVTEAKKNLANVEDGALNETFELKNKGQVLFSSSKRDSLASYINHMIHHRGQLTVYMRMNDIAVPSIYGPSADDKSWDGKK